MSSGSTGNAGRVRSGEEDATDRLHFINSNGMMQPHNSTTYCADVHQIHRMVYQKCRQPKPDAHLCGQASLPLALTCALPTTGILDVLVHHVMTTALSRLCSIHERSEPSEQIGFLVLLQERQAPCGCTTKCCLHDEPGLLVLQGSHIVDIGASLESQ